MHASTGFLSTNLEIENGVCAGTAPMGWMPLVAVDLLVMVGVTGVGKSTTLARMDASGAHLPALPDRRMLTDKLLIPAVQAAAGEPRLPVVDRTARFAYTRRFRAAFPGGMAQALTLLAVAPTLARAPLLFDGLRGADEIKFALAALPRARFVMLDAPDLVRVLRLLGRNDAFDQAGTPAGAAAVTLGDLVLDEVGAIFSEEEVNRLRELVAAGSISADEVRAKVRIVCEERRNYDPAATRALLAAAGPQRACIIDTTAHDSTAVAAIIVDACRSWFGAADAADWTST